MSAFVQAFTGVFPSNDNSQEQLGTINKNPSETLGKQVKTQFLQIRERNN